MNFSMCSCLLLILIFPSPPLSTRQNFLLCRDQDGISFGLNGKMAERERKEYARGARDGAERGASFGNSFPRLSPG